MHEWYYVKNGQQQGPVHLEQLREMAANGSLLPKDLVWNATLPNWIPASEIAGIFSSTSTPPAFGTPSPFHTPEPESLTEIPPGSQQIPISTCIERSFQLTAKHFGKFLLILLILIGINIAASSVFTAIDRALGLKPMIDPAWIEKTFSITNTTSTPGPTANDHSTSPPKAQNNFSKGFMDGYKKGNQGSWLNALLNNLLSSFLGLGLIRIGLNAIDNKPFGPEQLFSGTPFFLRAMIAGLAYGAITMLILLAFIGGGMALIPSIGPAGVILGSLAAMVILIMLALRFGYYSVAIVDRNLGILESFQYSSQITANNRLNLFGIALISLLLVIVGVIALCVGLLFAYPMIGLLWLLAYRCLQYGPAAAGKDRA